MCGDLPCIVASRVESIAFLDSAMLIEHPDRQPTLKFVTNVGLRGRVLQIDWLHVTSGKAVDLATLEEVWLDLSKVL